MQKKEQYSLEITTRSGLKEPFNGKVVLKTTSQRKPEIELFVVGKLQSEVKATPQYLYFGIIDTSKKVIDPKSLTRTVVVSNVKGTGLSIEKIETNANWIATAIETDKKGGNYSVVITLNKDKLPKEKFREKVVIHTQCNKKPKSAVVIIEGKVI